MRKKFSTITLFFFILLLFLFSFSPNMNIFAQSKINLKIGLTPVIDTILLHTAKRQGFFSEEQLSVDLIIFKDVLEKDAAVKNNLVDGYFCEMPSLIVQKALGIPFVIVANTSHTNRKHRSLGLITSPTSKALNILDLKDTTILTDSLSVVDFLTDNFLESKNLPLDFFSRLDIKKISTRYKMVLTSQTEAALLPEPYLTLIETSGGRVLFDDRNFDMPLGFLALREDLALPEIIDRIDQALSKAVIFINDNPSITMALMLELDLIPQDLNTTYTLPPLDPQFIPNTRPSSSLYENYLLLLTKKGGFPSNPQEEQP